MRARVHHSPIPGPPRYPGAAPRRTFEREKATPLPTEEPIVINNIYRRICLVRITPTALLLRQSGFSLFTIICQMIVYTGVQ